MKLTILIFHSFVFLLMIFKSEEATISYRSSIEDVYDGYKTFGIIIATAKNYFSLEKITILQELSREMSTKGIGSVVVNFWQLEDTVNFHQRRSARPLVVIFLDGITEVQEFREKIINMDMSYPVWLVLFTGDNDRNSCEYCRYPSGNPFNLKSNTEMLVSCCNSNYISKWSLDKIIYANTSSLKQKPEKVHKIKWHRNGTLYNYQQLSDSKELCIVTVQGSGDVWEEDHELQGYVGEIITELSRVMNFSVARVMEESTYGTFDPKSSMWTGAIGAVMQGKADIGASKFSMTAKRRSVVDFTSAIGSGQPGFYYQNPHITSLQWTGFLKVFQPDIWFVIIFLILITPILLTIIQYTRKNNLLDIISGNYLNIWGIFCQQGSSDSLSGGPLKIVYMAILMVSIIVYASYSAALIRHLTTSSEHATFRNIKDFIDYGTHGLIAIRDASNHQWIETDNDTMTIPLRKLLKPRDSLPITRKEAFEQVCKEKVAFFDNQAGEYLHENDVPCEIVSFTIGGKFRVGMILPKESEYKELVNYHIRRFRQNGLLDRMMRKYSKRRSQASISYQSVIFRDILPMLTFFSVGCFIAFIIFCIEK